VLLLATLIGPQAARCEGEGDDEELFFCGGMLANLTPTRMAATGEGGVGIGLGGRIHVNVLRYLRAGLMGHGSSTTFGHLDSEYRSGLGGVTVQARLPIGPLDLALGVLVGGDSATVHQYLDIRDDGTFVVDRLEVSGFLLSPHFDVEVTFIRRLKLALTIQFRHATWLDDLYEPTVTFHLGLLFNSYRPR